MNTQHRFRRLDGATNLSGKHNDRKIQDRKMNRPPFSCQQSFWPLFSSSLTLDLFRIQVSGFSFSHLCPSVSICGLLLLAATSGPASAITVSMSRNRPDASCSPQGRAARHARCRTDRGLVRTGLSPQWRGLGLPSDGSPAFPERIVREASRSVERSGSTGPSSRLAVGASRCAHAANLPACQPPGKRVWDRVLITDH